MKSFNIKDFINPAKENNVIYTWVWNEPINAALIDNQLFEFAKAGIRGIYILPMPENFRPTSMKTTLSPKYLSDDFFKCVKHVACKAKELDIELWLYDEGGWPSGGACGKTVSQNPKARETVLYERLVLLKSGEKYALASDIVASFAGKKRIEDGFISETDIEIHEYYAATINGNNPNRIDSTNKSVVDTFINNTYEGYKAALGDAFDYVSAIFTDEPSVIRKIIPEGFFELFTKKYGYDIKDYVYCIYDANLAETREECQARIDYGRLLGDLFCENYCENIGRWCKENGKLFAGHLDIDNMPDGGSKMGYFSHLRALSIFDIPGIDVICKQISPPTETTPAVAEGAPFFPRLASSAAHQTGKRLALTESFAVYGDGMTPDEIRYVLNYQAIRGINVFNIMLTASGSNGMSSLMERPVFSHKKPGFYNMEHLNKYFARLSYLLRLGNTQIDTALYLPCADFWANEKISQKAAGSYVKEGSLLEDQNIEFDIIDDYAILNAKATDEGLKLGNITYRNIVVPSCEFMPEEVRKKIQPYLTSGKAEYKSSNIKTMKRALSNGMLYFAFNQGPEEGIAVFDVPDSVPLYRLNIASGEINKVLKPEARLVCGDIAVFYSTENVFNTVGDEIDYTVELIGFKNVETRRFVITQEGISMKNSEISPDYGKDFSGEATYRTDYELPEIPCAGERYKIILENTKVSARITIDGKQVATVGITPMEAIIDGSDLRKQGVIEITVANTAGNEIVAKNALIATFPKEIVGQYHERSVEFEKCAPRLQFGAVKIAKLK